MIQAWITTEFDEVRMMFRSEDYERIMYCKERTNLHFNVHTTEGDFCWVHECDIPITLYAISCLVAVQVN